MGVMGLPAGFTAKLEWGWQQTALGLVAVPRMVYRMEATRVDPAAEAHNAGLRAKQEESAW